MRSYLHRIPLFLLCTSFATAEPPGIDQSLEFVIPPSGAWFIRWYGQSGRSYFIQASDPADHLNKWLFFPIIEAGNNAYTSHEVIGTPDKGFFRLKYTNQVPGPGETLNTADFDHDGIANLAEINATPQTDPLNPDTDGDGMPDGWEVSYGLDPTDASGVNGAYGDPDNDWMNNVLENQNGTNPSNPDTDFDGLNDGIELYYNCDPNNPDSDWDGLIDGDEVFLYYTSPIVSDTDNDGLSDYDEIYFYSTDPSNYDTDGDGLTDGDEINFYGVDPNLWDTDADGLNDGFEIKYDFNPNAATPTNTDTDGDGLDLLQEQYAGTVPTNADSDGDGISDGSEVAGGTSPTNPDTDGDAVPDKFEITLKSKYAYKTLYKYGFSTYQTTTPPKTYLKEVSSWTNMVGGNPESGPNGVGPGSRTIVFDSLNGSYTIQNSGVGSFYATTATAPTTSHDSCTVYNYDDPPNEINDEPGTVTVDSTLSDENTTEMLQANTNTLLPAYSADFDFGGYAESDMSVDESSYTLHAMKYKLAFGGSIQATLKWLEMFTPEDDPATTEEESENPTFTVKSWSGTGHETSEFEINPYSIDPTKDGRYDIVYVNEVKTEYLDPESHKISSNQYANNIMGMEHIVCVKDTGDIIFHAYFNMNPPESMQNKITWTCPNGSITSPGYGGESGSKLTAQLSSATPGKYPVTMKLDDNVMWEGVVWVIWASGVPSNRPLQFIEESEEELSSNIIADWDFDWTIEPKSVVSDLDHPDLSGTNLTPPPNPTKIHVIDNIGLVAGANRKWDVSRQARFKVINPHLYTKSQLPEVAGPYFDNQPVEVDIPDDFPTSSAEGNDDTHTYGEGNDPYSIDSLGKLRSSDHPSVPMFAHTGSILDTYEERYHFREFVRIELNGNWYRMSEYNPWRVHYKYEKRYVDGSFIWQNNGSNQANDNEGF
jgi:hypothetical protein